MDLFIAIISSFLNQTNLSSGTYEEERVDRVEFMETRVTRIGSIKRSAVRGHSIWFLDNISARNYARRSRAN